MDLTRNDLRRSVLQRLDTFTERVEWIGDAADYAFADSIIEFAKWVRGQPTALLPLPAGRPVQIAQRPMTARPQLDDRDPQPAETWRPVSSEWARRQAIDATRAAVNAAKDRKKTTNEESSDE